MSIHSFRPIKYKSRHISEPRFKNKCLLNYSALNISHHGKLFLISAVRGDPIMNMNYTLGVKIRHTEANCRSTVEMESEND